MEIVLDGVKKGNCYSQGNVQEFPINNFQADNGTSQIVESTELGESLRELNRDDFDNNSRMSGIDMRANLNSMEIAPLWAIDVLVSLGMFPKSVSSITRLKKRLSVSIGALGRENIVRIVSGNREHIENTGNGGIMSKIGNMFSGGQK